MTDPDRDHTGEPAEGDPQPGGDPAGGRTPHPEQPAEGDKEAAPGGADGPGR